MFLRKIATLALTSVALTLAAHQSFAEPAIDQPAPQFVAKAADGSNVDLNALRGKTVVLEWTNHECPFVVKHYDKSENIPDLQKEATSKGVVWLQVISSAPGNQGYVEGKTALEINKVRDSKPTNTILDPDGKLGKLYGAQTSPHIFIIDAKGTLVYKGGIDSIASKAEADIPKATNYVREALTAVAAGKKVPNPSTKPYGCSIKYAS
jgi:hypothetical protein